MATTRPPQYYLFWDTETTGLDHNSQIIQFGAILVDQNLEEVERTELFCLPRPDVIPAIGAYLTHKIPLSQIVKEGSYEPDFARKVNACMTKHSNTCVLGYNTIKFDDRVTREMNYRTNVDIYGREFQNENSRHDVLKLTRMISSMYPDMLNIPKNEEGDKSLRLEELAPLNNVLQVRAHDAMSDVEATIGVMKLIKEKNPGLFEHCMKLRSKHFVGDILEKSAFLYSDGYNDGMMKKITVHPKNKNSYICIDLKNFKSEDVDNILSLSKEEIQERMYNRDKENIPLREVRINQVPIVFPPSILKSQEICQNLEIDPEDIKIKVDMINSHPRIVELQKHLMSVFDNEMTHSEDVYGRIFDGFINDRDKRTMSKMSIDNLGDWEKIANEVRDPRVKELTNRALGNINPEYLSEEGKDSFRQWMVEKYNDETGKYGTTLAEMWSDAEEALKSKETSPEDKKMVKEIVEHVDYYAKLFAPALYEQKKAKIEEYRNNKEQNNLVSEQEENIEIKKDKKNKTKSLNP